MIKKYNILSTFILLLLSFLIEAQQIQNSPKFKQFKANSQLSNLNIYVIFQDSKGFLWVGTNDGLNRFDGYDIKLYQNIENDSLSLLKNEIQSIFEDSRGTLWVSTMNSGLHYYNRSLDAFFRIPEYSQKHCQVLRIVEDFNHNIWICGSFNSQAFVATLDNLTNTWKKFLIFPSKEGFTSMIQDSEDEFWLGSRSNGLFKWNSKSNVLTQYKHNPSNPNSLPGNYIQDITKDKFGNLWIGVRDGGQEGGLCKFTIKENRFKTFTNHLRSVETTIPSNSITDLCIDGNYLWIATENGGLSKMDMQSENLCNYLYNPSDPNTIINNSIWSLYKDLQGRLWVGSYAKGLCVFDPLEDKISVPDLSLENELVNAIFQDSKGRMWVGTESGLVMKDKSGVHYFNNDPSNKNSLGSNAVLCVYEDRKHNIWIGLWNGGINRFVESSKSFVRYVPDSKRKGSLTNPHVFSLTESSKTGELLVSTFGGLNILKDERAGIFESKFENPNEGDQYHITLFEDSKQNIWVGAYSGLSQYSLENKTVKQISVWNDATKVSDHINCIYEDRNGTLWVGSDGGLHKMSSPFKFVNYTVKDGLPTNVIRGILEDSKGNLWLGTTKGLTVFNPETKVFKTYDESDGLLSNQFLRKAFFKAKNGQMFVGGKGINTFFPDSIKSNPNKPSVYITDLKIFNQSIKPKSKDGILESDIAETKEIYLNHTHTSFSLFYVGINFTASYKNQYAFKLEGFDDDWINVGTQRFTTYTNLDQGTYTFRVKASNNDGLWNEEGASLIIHVLPPWWATLWFRSLLFFIIVMSLIIFYYFRISRIENNNRLLQTLVKERTFEIERKNSLIEEQKNELLASNNTKDKLFSILAHDLRAPFMTMIGFSEVLLKNLHVYNLEKIEKQVNHIHVTSRYTYQMLSNLLEWSRSQRGIIEFHPVRCLMSEIINSELGILIEQASQKEITINAKFEENEPEITVDTNMLQTVIRNLLSNAIKYSKPGSEITVISHFNETDYLFAVKDNGVGINQETIDSLFTLKNHITTKGTAGEKGTGLGLLMCVDFINKHNGKIWAESVENIGSTFYIKIPLI